MKKINQLKNGDKIKRLSDGAIYEILGVTTREGEEGYINYTFKGFHVAKPVMTKMFKMKESLFVLY